MMKNSEKSIQITCGIACYNHGAFLGEAVESILRQTLPPFEIILVDDCSTDNSLEVMHELQKTSKKIKIIENRPKVGHIAAYNQWIEMARGGVLHLFASDDRVGDSTYYARAARYLEDPEVGLVTCGLTHMNEDGELMDIGSVPPFNGVFPSKLWLKCMKKYGNFVNGGGTLIRAALQYKVGPYSSVLPKSADFLNMIIALSKCDRAAAIQEPIYHYRRHENQMTSYSHASEAEREVCMKALNSILGE